MTVTRLLVLGAVRILQPAHGYLVRRELGSWQVDEWAHLNPGSVYNALRTLTKDGLLSETPDPQPARGGPKASYTLTADGEKEFERLVREALWQLHLFEPGWLLAGLSFWWVLSREEVLDAFAGRQAALRARAAEAAYHEGSIARSLSTPVHVVEHLRLGGALVQGELAWTEEVVQRIRDGAYVFAGEPPEKAWPGAPPAGWDRQNFIQT